MTKGLFNEFYPVSTKQWKQKIQFDLKGADYNSALVWNTKEDISVKPFYHADSFDETPPLSGSTVKKWQICQTIFVSDAVKSNHKATNAIECGTDSIIFIIPSANISIKDLVAHINTEKTNIYFELEFLSESYVKRLSQIVPKSKISNDIIGRLTKTGNWFNNLNDDFKTLEYIVKTSLCLSINATHYQNAGASMVQELAYCLAHINEYLNRIDCVSNKTKIVFNIAVGTNYFFEIAKLKALRSLWYTLASAYNINTECHIIAFPTKRNKTLYDFNTNMLRTTTECMSAILGGTNAVCNLPYDAIYHKDNEFGERIARNQLLILKHESYFNKVNNPSDGAYYVESITNQLAEKALRLFKDIESSGGFLKQLKAGTIQRKIKESASKEQKDFDQEKEVLIGTNKFINENDKMKDELELYPFTKNKTRKTLIEPIIEKRLAEHLEQNRLKNEN